MRFRTKLALASTLGVFILSASTIWPILRMISSNSNEAANTNFAGMRQGLNSLQAERVSRMRQVGRLMMNIPELRALIAEDNFEISSDNLASLRDRLDDLTGHMDVGFICVLDGRGSVVAQNSSSPWPTLQDLRDYVVRSGPARTLVRRIYVRDDDKPADQGQFGMWLYRGQLYQVVGLPLIFGGSDHGADGAMIMAAPVTSEMAQDLAASHRCELTFLTNDGGIISSLPSDQSRELVESEKQNPWKAGVTFSLVLEGNAYRTYVEPLIDPCSQTALGQVISQASMAEQNTLRWRVTWRLFAIMSGGIVFAVAASLIFSGAMTSPVRELLRGVRRVSEGDFSAKISVTRRDEVGELGSAFNTMLMQLQARRELELRVAESQAASRAKSQFLANMSHEIRTPLHGVIGMANLLLGTNLDSRQRRYLQLVKSSTDVLTTLINDILDFSKIEAGKLELEVIEFDLHTVVEDVVELLYQKAISKGVEIICDISKDVPSRACGDPTRLRQILLNLIGNAVKFTEAGQVMVTVRRDVEGDDASPLRFEVKDTGIGISKAGLARLFESFSQVDASTTRRFGGTGLGLAIARQLCELMGGTIGVESEVGRGSTFRFTARISSAGSPQSEPAPLSGIRVLVTDRNAEVCAALARQLTILGAEATATVDAACRLISAARDENRPFRALLASRSVDGFATILTNASEQGIATLLLASSADPAAQSVLKEAGLRATVAKPVRRSQLLTAFAEALGIAGYEASGSGAAATEAEAAPAIRRARVLVAEDNEINQIVVAEFLNKAGFENHIVKDGKEAVEAFAAGKYDLILMDCQMPVMDGFEATALIRREEASRQAAGNRITPVPIIALTANASGADRGRCIAAGMNAYCGKPFRENELLDTIATLLGKDSPPPADPGRREPPEPRHSEGLNIGSLLDRCSGNATLALTVLEKFDTQVRDLVRQVQDCLQRRDAGQVARLTHSLKGTAGLLGAEPLQRALAEMEQMARQDALDDGRAPLERLQDEIARCTAGMREARSRLQAAS